MYLGFSGADLTDSLQEKLVDWGSDYNRIVSSNTSLEHWILLQFLYTIQIYVGSACSINHEILSNVIFPPSTTSFLKMALLSDILTRDRVCFNPYTILS